MNYYKIVNNYPQTYSGDKQLEGFKEFTTDMDEDGLVTYLPKVLNDAMIALEAQQAQDKTNQEARDYLASTDWLLLRELDGGLAMTAATKKLRADARARVI